MTRPIPIPPEAVEAAAKAAWKIYWPAIEWESLGNTRLAEMFREMATAALAAARPVIRNEALEEAAKRYEEDGDWDTFSSAAAAIRALKEKDNG